MNIFQLRRPSAAMVVALIALFVALGGVSYAAVKLPRNSVGPKHLKRNAVNSLKVKNASLKKIDVAAGQFLGATVRLQRTDVTLPAGPGVGMPGAATSGFTDCPADQILIGGAVNLGNPLNGEVVVSRPSTDNVGNGGVPANGDAMLYWKGTARSSSNTIETMRVFAICAG